MIRHIARLIPPRRDKYVRLFLGAAPVGYLTKPAAEALHGVAAPAADGGGMVLAGPGALERAAALLSEAGFYKRRSEDFDVRSRPDGPVLGRIDRGALPVFGLLAEGVHMNGIVWRADGLHLWVGKRAADRPMDPGKLDHLVAGGIPAGLTPEATLVKEAEEEASLPREMVLRARPVGEISYTLARPEGLRRDRLHCYDLELPEDFRPAPRDREIVGFTLMPAAEVMRILRETDDFKFNVAVVVIDCLLRHGVIGGAEGQAMRRALSVLLWDFG
jgi:8-oxo-dGTP pyrophosphatase MutT (NUDIX family)